jgi:hypothetical protein
MAWWRRLRDALQWLDDAEWPDGIAWPQGRPSRMPSFASVRAATVAAPIVVGAILIALGLPFGLTLVLFLLLGVLPNAGFITWRVVREAKRQGWGSNVS